ncbi:hypothetical protein RIF29_26829 [Crotalaria pallida]|uniref:Uncharacterized protein n=1 Tax=Crotalaria pallida TaxID=3830 RepID=A0AAN9I525_CROPI
MNITVMDFGEYRQQPQRSLQPPRRCHPPRRLQPPLHDRRNNHNEGVYEALELRDGGFDYLGKGVSKAVQNVKKKKSCKDQIQNSQLSVTKT